MAQHTHLVFKAFTGLMAAEGLMHPTVETDVHKCAASIFGFVHGGKGQLILTLNPVNQQLPGHNHTMTLMSKIRASAGM
jgi:hypothetical protein